MAFVTFLSGCGSTMTAEQAAPKVNKRVSEKVSVAVIDHRPYVLDGDKAPSFEGLSRSALGIPYSRYLIQDKPMSDYLVNRLVAGFKKAGVEVSGIQTTPQLTVSELAKTETKTVVVILKEWKYDYHTFVDSSWYDFDVLIKDQNGKELIRKNFAGEQDVPSLTSNDLQLLYKARFELAFNDTEIQKYL